MTPVRLRGDGELDLLTADPGTLHVADRYGDALEL
jgi:hypothetical protein